ncbi:hypothetical protein [Pantoea stewartii]|uniref:hypothetical protein n=1 Tax=Pantoea stewartii TaxID=66269 RepID=UPI00197FC14D|nr:hypothetical protein [Pantoea stewartii]
MKKILIAVLIVFSFGASAATNEEIISEVKEYAHKSLFPADVSVEKIDNVKFFPSEDDTQFGRSGNACGLATISKGATTKRLVFIAPVKEKSSSLLVGTPSIYDLDGNDAVARDNLKKYCK